MKRYALGLDFGTLSVRALLLDLETGQEAAGAEYVYPHGIMTDRLPDGTELPEDFALEHPLDFLDGMQRVVADAMRQLGITGAQVAGIGLDVTSPTVLPLDAEGTPLCLKPEYASRPHAWMKLWKHHGANEIARRMLETAQRRQEPWLQAYGGCLGSELFICKAVEFAVKDPEVFEAAYTLQEAADWLVWQLTGNMVRSFSMAGCTGSYRDDTGYPSKTFFKEAYPQAERVCEKFRGEFIRLGQRAGYLQSSMAAWLGLEPGTPVGIGTLDSHAGVIGCGASRLGDMVLVIGTSACSMLNAETTCDIPSIYCAAMDANLPGMYGYEGSQNCVGDMLAWFVENCVPYGYYQEAQRENMSIHDYLTQKAARLKPGESGLLALDWFHGVRTPYMDLSLASSIVGLSIRTKPEEIYRALLEAAAFGQRRIIELFTGAGCSVDRIIAGGGIPGRNPLLMQIYADVCKREIYLSKTSQASALGSAILGAAAAGEEVTGCKDVPSLMDKYIKLADTAYRPFPEHSASYDKLYKQYLRLSEQTAHPDSVSRELKKQMSVLKRKV